MRDQSRGHPDADVEGEAHQHDGEEGGDPLGEIRGIELADPLEHQRPEHDEGDAGCVEWDGGEDRSEPEREREERGYDHGDEAGASPLTDPDG